MTPDRRDQVPEYMRKIKEYPGLRLENLDRAGLLYFQLEDSFRFGNEQIFLVNFAKSLINTAEMRNLENGNSHINILDPGAGAGILTVLSSVHIPNSQGVAIELMERPYELLQANLKMNNLDKRFRAVRADIKILADSAVSEVFSDKSNTGEFDSLDFNFQEQFDFLEQFDFQEHFDLAICNPPYFKQNSGPTRDLSKISELEVSAARDEIFLSLDDYMKFVSKSLKYSGKMALLHRPERLVEVINIASKYQLYPYFLRAVLPKYGAKVKVFLLALSKGKQRSFEWGKDLVIYNNAGEYTDEVAAYYSEVSEANEVSEVSEVEE